MFLNFSTYVEIVALGMVVGGLVMLAGTDRNTWAERRNSVGCLLLALALLLHGICVSGAALLSPRKFIHGDVCAQDLGWGRTTQLWISVPHVVPGPEPGRVPCIGGTSTGVLLYDAAPGKFADIVRSGKVFEAYVDYTMWDRKVRNIRVTALLSPDRHAWLPANFRWKDNSTLLFYLEMTAAVLMLVLASYIWVAARHKLKVRGTAQEILTQP